MPPPLYYIYAVTRTMEQGDWNSSPATVNKQFEPKKYKDGVQRLKQENSAVFTPFKTTLSRSTTPSIDGATSRKSQTLRPPRASPFVYETLPASQSTPKVARPGSAMQMGKEQKLTWGRLPPNPSNLRCASAAAGNLTLRPPSRQSDLMMNGVSRYQSYNTLPRPEQLEPEHLMEGNHVIPYFPRIVSRSPSAVPGMASDFVRPPSAIPAPILVHPPLLPNVPLPQNESTIINWGTLGTFSALQVLVGLFIFSFGILRTLKEAKWAIGVELFYASFVIVAALAGIVACRRNSYAYAIFAYGMTTLNVLFAVPSFILGLFPLVPYVFPEWDASHFVANDEPFAVDISLSIAVAIQQLLNLIVIASGCYSLGKVCQIAEEFKFRFDTEAAFSDNVLPPKV